MNKQQIMDCLKKQKKILEDQNYKVAYICVYGSNNYGLYIYNDEYKSDLDMKCIIVPTLNDLIYNCKPISTTINTEWGEIDVKDIRSYMETLLKANPAYVETLYTDYYIIDDDFTNEMNSILECRDELICALRLQFLRAMYGMSLEKQKALTYPYPTIAAKIEKYGTDGKQSHHCVRLNLMMRDYFYNHKPLKECFIPPDSQKERLIKHKLNQYSFDEIVADVDFVISDSKNMRDEILNNTDENKIDYSVKDKVISLSRDIIRNKIVSEVKNNYD